MIKTMDPRFAHFTPEMDARYIRRAIEVADEAVAVGNHPFGCVLVDIHGKIIMEQGNIEVTEKVCTGHAETTLMQRASHELERDFLWNCTLYTSIEPCCMCCGAVYWGNVGRIVYGASEQDLLMITGNHKQNPTFRNDCRSILATGQKDLVIQGPIPELRDEILRAHRTYWNR